MAQEKIIQKFAEKLGDDDFVSPSSLVSAGIYGSYGAVRQALIKGDLPSIRISRHRTLIPREGVIEYLKSCVTSAE